MYELSSFTIKRQFAKYQQKLGNTPRTDQQPLQEVGTYAAPVGRPVAGWTDPMTVIGSPKMMNTQLGREEKPLSGAADSWADRMNLNLAQQLQQQPTANTVAAIRPASPASNRKGRPVWELVVSAIFIVLGLLFLISSLVRILQQRTSCREQVGHALWDHTSPQIYFEDGFFASTTCNFLTTTTLTVSNAGLTELPAAITSYSELQQLTISDNQIDQLPLELQQLSKLQVLDARNNRITAIPLALALHWGAAPPTLMLQGNPVSLRVDWSHRNLSGDLPPVLLALVDTLQSLNLRGNRFAAVPPLVLQFPTLQEVGSRIARYSS